MGGSFAVLGFPKCSLGSSTGNPSPGFFMLLVSMVGMLIDLLGALANRKFMPFVLPGEASYQNKGTLAESRLPGKRKKRKRHLHHVLRSRMFSLPPQDRTFQTRFGTLHADTHFITGDRDRFCVCACVCFCACVHKGVSHHVGPREPWREGAAVWRLQRLRCQFSPAA